MLFSFCFMRIWVQVEVWLSWFYSMMHWLADSWTLVNIWKSFWILVSCGCNGIRHLLPFLVWKLFVQNPYLYYFANTMVLLSGIMKVSILVLPKNTDSTEMHLERRATFHAGFKKMMILCSWYIIIMTFWFYYNWCKKCNIIYITYKSSSFTFSAAIAVEVSPKYFACPSWSNVACWFLTMELVYLPCKVELACTIICCYR